jgi:hypothetical protein
VAGASVGRQPRGSWRLIRRIPPDPTLERNIEKLLLASRWLLAPIYVDLSVGIFAIGVKFFLELGTCWPASW